MDNSPYQDSPYGDDNTTSGSSNQPSTSAQTTFEAEAAKIRARMPYKPPSPSNAPLARDSGISALSNGNGLPSFVRDAPTSRAPNQMSREGPIPRTNGERELDFYERLTPRNQKLFKLYAATTLCGVIGMASVVYTAWNLHFMKVFSPAAKGVLLGVYGGDGFGGLAMMLVPSLGFAVQSLITLLRQSQPHLEIWGAIATAIDSILLAVFTLLSFLSVRDQGQEHAVDGVFDPCVAPGADKWKRLQCGEAWSGIWKVQMLGLTVVGVASILFAVLTIVHFVEAKSGGGSMFSRQKGYVRLEQNSLNPYEVHDAYEDEEPRGRAKP